MSRRDGQDKNFLNLTCSSFLPHCELMAAHQNGDISDNVNIWVISGDPGSVGSSHHIVPCTSLLMDPQYSYTVQITHSIEIERFYQN